MRILLTGAGGVLSSVMLDFLVQKNHDVVAVSRSAKLDVPGVNSVQMDLAREHLDCSTFDAIIHTAGTAMASGASPAQIINDNVVATKNLFFEANKASVKKFIFFSTMSVYGKVLAPVVNENTPIVSPNIYGTSKFLCEQLLEHCDEKMGVFVLRLPAVLAKNVWGHWLSEALYRAKTGQPIIAYNPEGTFNNTVDVRDLSKFVLCLLEKNATGFNRIVLGSEDNIKIREIFNVLHTAYQLSAPVKFAMAEGGFKIDPSRGIKEFGFSPRPIHDSILDYFSGSV